MPPACPPRTRTARPDACAQHHLDKLLWPLAAHGGWRRPRSLHPTPEGVGSANLMLLVYLKQEAYDDFRPSYGTL